jgi:hypothetical protein
MTRSRKPRPLAVPVANLAVAAALLGALAAPAAAGAAHPLVSDDAGTLGAAVLQLELTGAGGLERSRQAGVRLQEDASLLAAAFSWGLHDDLDLVVGLPLAWSRRSAGGPETSPVSGVGDVLLEAKWRFLEAGGFSLALKPGLSLPTGDATFGLGTGRPCIGAALLATQLIGPVSLHLNAAFAHDEFARAEDRQGARADHWHASAAIVAEVTPVLQLVANLGAATSTDRNDPTPPAFALGGLIYAVTGSLDLDCGVKVGLTDPEPGLVLLAGLAARY